MLVKTDGTTQDGQSRDIDNVEHTIHRTNKCQKKPIGQSRMDNAEIFPTLDTPCTRQINVRENRWDNHEWTFQSYWQRWTHITLQCYVILLFTPGFQWGSCYSIFSFMCMFCRSFFAISSFLLLAIVLSVLQITDSDYILWYLQAPLIVGWYK